MKTLLLFCLCQLAAYYLTGGPDEPNWPQDWIVGVALFVAVLGVINAKRIRTWLRNHVKEGRST